MNGIVARLSGVDLTLAWWGWYGVACIGIGYWAGRRAPESVEAPVWRRMGRKLRRFRDALA